MGLKAWWRGRPRLLDLLFPRLCVLCTTPLDRELWVCDPCLDALPRTGLGQWRGGTLVHSDLDEVWTAFWFDTRVQTLIHLFKYEGNRSLGARLGAAAFRALEGDLDPQRYDVIVPVPLHRARRRDRGYNQAEILARKLGQLTGLPVDAGRVLRHRSTRSQTGLTIRERQANVAGCFKVRQSGEGQRILLVDDVLTTGATASACGQTLKEQGYGQIGVLTMATPLKDG